MKRVRIAIIGAGQIAQTTHIPNYQAMEDVEIVGVCDTCLEAARNVAEQYHIPGFYTSHIQMIDELKPDAVTICVPNKFHYQVTMDALSYGCHVFCEKPPAITADQAEEMEKKAIEKGKMLTYGFHMRSSERIQFLRRNIVSGNMGEIYHLDVKWHRRRGIPGWGNFIDKERQGGGPLIDIGAHVLDCALFLLDYPEISYVCGSYSNFIGTNSNKGLMGSWDPKKFTVEDSLFGYIKFRNGCSLDIQTSFAINRKERDLRNIRIYGSKQGASVFPFELYGEEQGILYDKTFPFAENEDLHLKLDKNFIQACLGKEGLIVKAQQGTYIQKLICRLYESAESNLPIIFNK